MSDERHLPIQYRIEIYEDSFYNDPSASFHSSTPFLPIHVGDYIETRSWNGTAAGSVYKELADDETLQVISLNHLLWLIEDSHVGHSLSVCVKVVKKPH